MRFTPRGERRKSCNVTRLVALSTCVCQTITNLLCVKEAIVNPFILHACIAKMAVLSRSAAIYSVSFYSG